MANIGPVKILIESFLRSLVLHFLANNSQEMNFENTITLIRYHTHSDILPIIYTTNITIKFNHHMAMFSLTFFASFSHQP